VHDGGTKKHSLLRTGDVGPSCSHLNGVLSGVLPRKAVEAPTHVHDFQRHKAAGKLFKLKRPQGCNWRVLECVLVRVRVRVCVCIRVRMCVHTCVFVTRYNASEYCMLPPTFVFLVALAGIGCNYVLSWVFYILSPSNCPCTKNIHDRYVYVSLHACLSACVICYMCM